MKSNNKAKTPFRFNKPLFLILAPIALMLVAMIILLTVGFNKGIDYKNSYTFDVTFNTTITSSEYKEYKTKLSSAVEDQNLEIYSITKIGEGVYSGYQVRVLKNSIGDNEMTNRIDAVEASLDTKLAGVNDTAVFSLKNVHKITPNNYTNDLLFGFIAIICIAIVAFIYVWIRWEIKIAMASLICLPYSIGLTLSLQLIFRLPLNKMFMLPVYFAVIITYLLFVIIANNIRGQLKTEDAKKVQNIAIVKNAIVNTKTSWITLLSCITAVLVISLCVFSNDTLVLLLPCLFAIISSLYAVGFVFTATWIKTYDVERDSRLRKSKERALAKEKEIEEQKLSKKPKDNDKIVV